VTSDRITRKQQRLDALATARRRLADGLPTYEVPADDSWFTCQLCGSTSHNPNDVAHRYCVRCAVFHEDLPEVVRLRA